LLHVISGATGKSLHAFKAVSIDQGSDGLNFLGAYFLDLVAGNIEIRVEIFLAPKGAGPELDFFPTGDGGRQLHFQRKVLAEGDSLLADYHNALGGNVDQMADIVPGITVKNPQVIYQVNSFELPFFVVHNLLSPKYLFPGRSLHNQY